MTTGSAPLNGVSASDVTRDKGETRFELTREANLARERLVATIVQLERRGERLLDWRSQMRRHSKHLAAIAGVLVASLSLALGVAAHRARKRSRERPRERARALARWWRYPERIASPPPPVLGGAWGLAVALTKLATALSPKANQRRVARSASFCSRQPRRIRRSGLTVRANPVRGTKPPRAANLRTTRLRGPTLARCASLRRCKPSAERRAR